MLINYKWSINFQVEFNSTFGENNEMKRIYSTPRVCD